MAAPGCLPSRLFGSALVSAMSLALTACSPGDPGTPAGVGPFDYKTSGRLPACRAGDKIGKPGATNALVAPNGIRYSVRAPSNYDPTIPHPLLMVYAPAGLGEVQNEAFTRFTWPGTTHGFVVAYAEHRTMSVATVEKLAELPHIVAQQWCIDPERIYATGHSDGGTAATAIALLDQTTGTFHGIAPSGAGFSKSDFATFNCPPVRFPVMVVHSEDDALFPNWGAEAAEWWAACNGCATTERLRAVNDACVAYQGCVAPTQFCETSLPHAKWPHLETEIVRFFEPGDDPLQPADKSTGARASRVGAQ